MKQEQGLGRIMTFLLLILIIFVIAIAVYLLYQQYNQETIETFKTEMIAVQGKVTMVARENAIDAEEHPLLGELLEGQEEVDWVKTLLEEQTITSTTGMYKITQKELNILQLETIQLEEGEYFLVNYTTQEVYCYMKAFPNHFDWYALEALLQENAQEEVPSEEQPEDAEDTSEEEPQDAVEE